MTIVVEDGSGSSSPTPNSYVTIAEFRDFWTDRNDSLDFNVSSPYPSPGDGVEDVIVEAALRRAWDYMLQRYRLRWVGSRAKAFQAGDWPRRGVPVPDFFDPFYRNVNVPFNFRTTLYVPENEVPQEVKDAQMFLARAAISDATTVTALQTSLGRRTKREKLDVLEVEYADASEGGARETTYYWDSEQRLKPFLKFGQVGTVLRS